MNDKVVLKIKDSVDIFLSNDKYLMVYYMNTRQKKSFRVNEEMIYLLEAIDGTKSIDELTNIMQEEHDVSRDLTHQAIVSLKNNRIITEILETQTIISKEAFLKYNRQINYFAEFCGSEAEGIAAQKKIMDSHILIFGCGAIGGDIALQLVMAGAGHIALFDCDYVEESDTSRHMFYRNEYLGLLKVDALKKELQSINPDVEIYTYTEYMHPTLDIKKLIQCADFIVNTLDEPYIGYTASKISRICIKENKPHFIAGGFDAHLASTGELIIPYVTPCVECYTKHFKEALKDWKPKKHPVKKRFNEIGGLASMSLFSSSFACVEIIKYLAGLIKMNDNYKVRGEFLFCDMSLTYLNVNKNPNCPICGGESNDET